MRLRSSIVLYALSSNTQLVINGKNPINTKMADLLEPPTTNNSAAFNPRASPTLRFHHVPLRPRQIRLLRLSAEGDATGLVSGTCSPASLDDHSSDTKSFIALSYFWGNPKPTQVIVIKGSQFGVTENLYSYLRGAQTRVKVDYRPLWIDAICID